MIIKDDSAQGREDYASLQTWLPDLQSLYNDLTGRFGDISTDEFCDILLKASNQGALGRSCSPLEQLFVSELPSSIAQSRTEFFYKFGDLESFERLIDRICEVSFWARRRLPELLQIQSGKLSLKQAKSWIERHYITRLTPEQAEAYQRAQTLSEHVKELNKQLPRAAQLHGLFSTNPHDFFTPKTA
jgi:hypothetical protein